MDALDQQRFARQLSLFGKKGQKKIRSTNLVLVGMGGLSSIVLPELILLGVRKATVIEPESFDLTNRGRYMGFSHSDVGKKKCDVAIRIAHSIDPDCDIETICSPLESEKSFEAIKKATIVVAGLDSDGPRAILNELCIAYDIPYIDIASEVFPDGSYGGRVAVVTKGHGCLDCMGSGLDKGEISTYLSDRKTRENKAAIYGVDSKFLSEGSSPSVVSINGVIASLGVTEFQALITEIRDPYRYLNYRGHLQSITKGEMRGNESCYFCSQHKKGSSANVERYLQR